MTDNPLHDSMLKHEQLILINHDDNSKYRILVQTPGELDYSDIGIKSVDYPEEGFEDASSSLIGYHISEEPNEHEIKLGIKPAPFGSVVNAGYCPQFGTYADIEVFNDNYKPVLENMYQRLKDGEPVKKGFSTEVNPIDMEPLGDNKYRLNKWTYDGIVMTHRPRDKGTGLCDIIANSEHFIKDIGGSDMPKEEVKQVTLTETEYDTLIGVRTDYEKLQEQYEEGKKLYSELRPEDFEEYQKLEQEKEDLFQQLVPIWTAQEGEKLELVNSLVEQYPEDKQEEARAKFEAMDTTSLKLINSIPKGEEAKGVVTPQTHEQSDEPTKEELELAYKAMGIK